MAGKNEFVVLTTRVQEEFAVLGGLTGFDERFKLNFGVSIVKDWPDDVTFKMDDDFPTNIGLADSMDNQSGSLLVSEKMRDALTELVADQLEFLPATIFNHRKKKENAAYFVVNAIDPVDCINIEKSDLTWRDAEQSRARKAKNLVLNEAKIPEGRSLFVLKRFGKLRFVRRTVYEELLSRGITGMFIREWNELPPTMN